MPGGRGAGRALRRVLLPCTLPEPHSPPHLQLQSTRTHVPLSKERQPGREQSGGSGSGGALLPQLAGTAPVHCLPDM